LRILFDHNVNRKFKHRLPGHEVKTAREMGWDRLSNGKLLRAAAAANFNALITLDKNLPFQLNPATFAVPTIVLGAPSDALLSLGPFAAHVLRLLENKIAIGVHVVKEDGRIIFTASA
jgi:hypothetical protein